ncbi:MAG TPA: peptidoglycan recognition family protein [Pyrinomonadaceae bacterium]|nr:peptidoglycan recognition family protein [Pyrinomonadaceae bacterium]
MLLVRTVSGPSQIVAGTRATYRVTSYNTSNPLPEEVAEVNWLIKSGEETVARFEDTGDTLNFDVPANLVGRSIVVMPFMNTPTAVVSVTSRVVSESDIISTGSAVTVLSRTDWGARTDLPRLGVLVDPTRRREVFIHHTVIVDSDATKNEFENREEVVSAMRVLQTVRRQDLGADVPYSFVGFCMKSGDLILCEGRGLNRKGAHTKGHNTVALGISLQGNFQDVPLPEHFDAQLTALGNWLRRLRQEEGFVNLGADRPHGRDVFGHRDITATACPGKHTFDKLKLIRFL